MIISLMSGGGKSTLLIGLERENITRLVLQGQPIRQTFRSLLTTNDPSTENLLLARHDEDATLPPEIVALLDWELMILGPDDLNQFILAALKAGAIPRTQESPE